MILGHARRAASSWAATGLVDLEFYGALRDSHFDDAEEAARDWVSFGMAEGLSPHPLLDFHSLPAEVRRRWRRGEVDAVLEHLGPDRAPIGPLTAHPDRAQAAAHLRELAARLGQEAAGRAEPVWVGGISERDEVTDSVLVVTPALQPGARAVRRLVEDVPPGTQIVVVDQGTEAHAALGLHARLLRDGAERVRLHPGSSYVDALDAGFAHVRGARLVVVRPHVLVRSGWMPGLMAALREASVAVPVVLDELDLVVSPPSLCSHPPEDVEHRFGPLEPRRPLDVAAMRTAAVRQGSDLARMMDLEGGVAALVPSSRVTSLRARRPLRTSSEATSSLPPTGALRWSLNLPSTPGPWGDLWGDTMFGESLARGLRSLGQTVVTRRHGAHQAGPVELDDVHLTIRGLRPATPTPGVVNLLWVISHPETVIREEVVGFDAVFAASPAWAAARSREWNLEVQVLLQATEVTAPSVAPPKEPSAVFVGSGNGERDRPLVTLALDAGVPLVVHGPGWQGRLPRGVWASEFVPNDRLADVYASHALVLADHWPEMAAQGFVANRVFDAVAAGSRVVSDDVAGIEQVFGDVVSVARSTEDMRSIWDRAKTDSEVDLTVARRTAHEHSFETRAATLMTRARGLAPRP